MDDQEAVLNAFAPFLVLTDPRSAQGLRHKLLDVIVIALCGALCGVDNAEELEDFGRAKEKWFGTFLDLPHGIPSQDTFLRVFAVLDPDEFRRCFVAWADSLRKHGAGDIIAIDGKSLRRAFDAAGGGTRVHMVNAWLRDEGLVLGTLKTAAKSNEITAIPELLDLLNVKNSTVTTDAMGCQRKIAKKIVDGGGDYMLQVAEHHPTMYAEIVDYFDFVEAEGEEAGLSMHQSIDKGHGRLEERTYWHSTDVGWFADKQKWEGLASFAKVTAKRTDLTTEASTEHSRYYISTYDEPNAGRAAKAIRGHWGVENGLHWVLDMAFDEDRNRCRTRHAAENFAMVRQVAVNLIKQETSNKKGVLTKRKRCGWDHDYLLKVIGLRRDA